MNRLAGVVGLEPTNAGVKVPCLDQLGYTPILWDKYENQKVLLTKMAPRTGLEPVTF